MNLLKQSNTTFKITVREEVLAVSQQCLLGCENVPGRQNINLPSLSTFEANVSKIGSLGQEEIVSLVRFSIILARIRNFSEKLRTDFERQLLELESLRGGFCQWWRICDKERWERVADDLTKLYSDACHCAAAFLESVLPPVQGLEAYTAHIAKLKTV
jgi:hypothetical protein